MAALKWDQDGTRLYETGTKNAVLYVKDSTGYQTGVAWNGITGFTASPSGAESNPLWADDIKYLDLRSREEFGATIEAYTYPDKWAECDGSRTVTGAKGVYLGQQTRKSFGFTVKTTVGNDTEFEDHGYKLHLVYNATASPSEKSYATINDSPEAITFSWEITTTPVKVEGYDSQNIKDTAYVCIDTTQLDNGTSNTKLKDLENVLYGTAGTDPRLPSIEEVLYIMGSPIAPPTGSTGGTGAVGGQG